MIILLFIIIKITHLYKPLKFIFKILQKSTENRTERDRYEREPK